jgi:hypothetical protein
VSSSRAGPPESPAPVAPAAGRAPADLKNALLAEIRKTKVAFYNMVVAQAQKIEVAEDRVTFTFSATQRALHDAVEQNRAWLESIAHQASGRRIAIASVQLQAATSRPAEDRRSEADKKVALREQALADAGVQAMLEVFPAEIRDVEEM